ncbi:hypothetical protein CsSME_00002076 [Camellia sinensis var. sinensis]|nr:uncharacterized protein LOC114286076 isoform X1 [Camellia sinensis]
MLGSISTGKSSSKKWLDRLRLSKGFPAGNDLDLEQFLNYHNPEPELNSISVDPSEKPVLDRSNQTAETPRQNGDKEWFGLMSNVLAELFNMGDPNDSSRIHSKKSSRKQPNPRICLVSTPSNVDSENDALRSSGDNSCAEVKQTSDDHPSRLRKEENVENVDVDFGEDDKFHADLSAFSRTDVTVIDTSVPLWKCEKLLFRRKNVWRVREKKSKSTAIGMKKRKANLLEDESNGGEKKPKRRASSKDANGEECMMPSNQVHLQSDKMNKDQKEKSNVLGQVPKKRQADLFPRKSKKCGSSVILIKSVPTSKKNGANIPKSCLKLSQRPYKA